jgi:hypothetical protein
MAGKNDIVFITWNYQQAYDKSLLNMHAQIQNVI